MTDAILTLNAGSSSLKFSLYELGDGNRLSRLSEGRIEGIGVAPRMIARDPSGATLTERRWPAERMTHEDFLADLLTWVDEHLGGDRLAAAGHRVVHGGAQFSAPIRIDDAALTALDRLSPLAPLHQPHNLSAIRAIRAARPDLPQVACFDTGFHHGQPEVATRLALPADIRASGVRRYGFHGLSYEYVAGRLRDLAPRLAAGRVIVAHLGNGASLCGMIAGQSVETSMGFTALDGLIMGTRCGTLDPGVPIHLMRERGLDAAALEDLLYNQSGLLGLSGLSSDMRVLLASAEPAARDAVDSFVYRITREAGGIVSALGGLDGLVFTAGIGENAPPIRAAVAARLGWLGLALDEAANAVGAGRISAPSSRVEAWVIPTDEEGMIARHTFETVTA